MEFASRSTAGESTIRCKGCHVVALTRTRHITEGLTFTITFDRTEVSGTLAWDIGRRKPIGFLCLGIPRKDGIATNAYISGLNKNNFKIHWCGGTVAGKRGLRNRKAEAE